MTKYPESGDTDRFPGRVVWLEMKHLLQDWSDSFTSRDISDQIVAAEFSFYPNILTGLHPALYIQVLIPGVSKS